VDVKMALMDDGIPVDWIDFLDHFLFVVVNDDVVLEGFFDLGQEVSMDNGDFLGSVRIFWLKFEAEHDLLVETASLLSEGVGRSVLPAEKWLTSITIMVTGLVRRLRATHVGFLLKISAD
jgi:hypothetical protein